MSDSGSAAAPRLLVTLTGLSALSAIGGGFALLLSDGLGMSPTILEHSWFSSFIIPGLLLALVVGGIQLTATVLLIAGARWALPVSAMAGSVLLVWIYGEIYTTQVISWLQTMYFIIGLAELWLVLLQRSILPKAPSS